MNERQRLAFQFIGTLPIIFTEPWKPSINTILMVKHSPKEAYFIDKYWPFNYKGNYAPVQSDRVHIDAEYRSDSTTKKYLAPQQRMHLHSQMACTMQ